MFREYVACVCIYKVIPWVIPRGYPGGGDTLPKSDKLESYTSFQRLETVR